MIVIHPLEALAYVVLALIVISGITHTASVFGSKLAVMHYNRRVNELANASNASLERARDAERCAVPLPQELWHEDTGPVLWLRYADSQPPTVYVGTPLDESWPRFANPTTGLEEPVWVHLPYSFESAPNNTVRSSRR